MASGPPVLSIMAPIVVTSSSGLPLGSYLGTRLENPLGIRGSCLRMCFIDLKASIDCGGCVCVCLYVFVGEGGKRATGGCCSSVVKGCL